MDELRWQKVETIIDEVLDLPPEKRKSHIQLQCEGDETLKGEVTQLLKSIFDSQGWLEDPKDYKNKFYKELSDDIESLSANRSIIGTKVGAYTIKEQIGKGGMGSVYLAERTDEEFQHSVAIKIIRHGQATRSNILRFRREQQILADLNHPGIATLHDGGVTEDGFLYIIMEYVDGVPIDEYCRQHNASLEDKIELFKQVLKAVRHAHENLVIHRDLKPANILVDQAGVKILDFGISKLLEEEDTSLTQTGARLLTPKYAAPEQIKETNITTATDLYALGIVFYELLAGVSPFNFQDASQHEIEQIILQKDPPSPSSRVHSKKLKKEFRGDLDAIALKAIRKEPDQRYRVASDFLSDLENYRKGLPITARRDSVQYRSKKFLQRHKQGIAIVIGIFLLTIGFAGLYTWRIAEERDQAQYEAQRAKLVKEFMLNIFQATDPEQKGFAGSDITAQQLLDIGASKVEQNLQQQPKMYIEMMLNIAQASTYLENLDIAETYFRNAIHMSESALGKEDLITADTYHAITSVFFYNTQYDSAEYYSKQALDIYKSNESNATVTLAEYMSIYAKSLAYLGKFDQAISVFEESDSLFLALGADTNTRRLATRRTFGSLFTYLNKYEEAENILLANLDIYPEIYELPHTKVAAAKQSLAALYHSKNQNQKAQKYILSAIEDFNQLVGTKNAQLGEAYDVLAGIKIDLGEYKEALEASEKAVDIFKKLGDAPTHPYLNKLSNYADALSHTGNNQKALETYQYIVNEKRKLDGDTHPYMAASYYNLAVQQDNMGLNNEAIRNYEKSITITETNFGADNKDIAYKYHNLAAILAKAGNHQKADSLFKKAGFIYENQYGNTSLRKGNYYLDRGKFEFNEGNFKVADSLLNNALKVYSTHYSSDNPKINEINSLLASMK